LFGCRQHQERAAIFQSDLLNNPMEDLRLQSRDRHRETGRVDDSIDQTLRAVHVSQCEMVAPPGTGFRPFVGEFFQSTSTTQTAGRVSAQRGLANLPEVDVSR